MGGMGGMAGLGGGFRHALHSPKQNKESEV